MNAPRLPIRGFTLLELLLVLLIVGLGIAVASLNVTGNRPQQLLAEARALANGAAAVADSAVLDTAPWGLQFYRETVDGEEHIAYRWLHFGAEGWQVEAPPDLRASTRFDTAIEAVLIVEGSEQRIEPLPRDEGPPPATDERGLTPMQQRERTQARRAAERERQGPQPHVWMAPGGEMTPFELQLRFAGERSGPVIRGDALGRIELERGAGLEKRIERERPDAA